MDFTLDNFSMDFFSLKGKVAIVTGGKTGLGKAYVVGFQKAGADLFVITYDENWEETRALVESYGRKIVFYKADLTVKSAIKGFCRSLRSTYGKIDILVNNAGTIRRAPLLEYKDEDWDAVMNVNLNAVYHLSQECKIMVPEKVVR